MHSSVKGSGGKNTANFKTHFCIFEFGSFTNLIRIIYIQDCSKLHNLKQLNGVLYILYIYISYTFTYTQLQKYDLKTLHILCDNILAPM